MTMARPESTESSRRLRRFARWCACLPAVLGVAAILGWLAVGGRQSDVGPFYFLGIFAIGLGLLLLPLGVGAALWSLRRGASGRSVALHAALLLANVPLAVACWTTASSLLDLHVVRIENSSDQVVGPIRVWIEPELESDHGLDIAALQPGESRTWVLHYSHEGVATFRAQQESNTIEPTADERVFLGIGQTMEVDVEFQNGGQYRVAGTFARRWWWLSALGD